MKRLVIYAIFIIVLIIVIAVVYNRKKKKQEEQIKSGDYSSAYGKDGKLLSGWMQPQCITMPCNPIRIK